MLCNVPEEWRVPPHRNGSLKSHIEAEFIVQEHDKKQSIILTQSVPKCIQTQSNMISSLFHTGNHFPVIVCCYIQWVIAFYHSQWQSYRSDASVFRTGHQAVVLWTCFALGSIPSYYQLTYTWESLMQVHITLKLVSTKQPRHVSNPQVQK
jgi:hypothetical protein